MEVQSAMGSGVFSAVVDKHRSDEQAAVNALDKNSSNSSKKSPIPVETLAAEQFDSLGLLRPVENRGSVFDLLG